MRMAQKLLPRVYVKYLYCYGWCGISKPKISDVYKLDLRTVAAILICFWREEWKGEWEWKYGLEQMGQGLCKWTSGYYRLDSGS